MSEFDEIRAAFEPGGSWTASMVAQHRAHTELLPRDAPDVKAAETAVAFRGFLRQLRGSCLRAFRLDLDRRGAGRIAQMDFASACRRLGPNLQGGLIWRALHRGQGRPTDPLSFQDIDPEESENLEMLADAIRKTFGFHRDTGRRRRTLYSTTKLLKSPQSLHQGRVAQGAAKHSNMGRDTLFVRQVGSTLRGRQIGDNSTK